MDWTSLAGSALDKAGSAASFGKGVATGVGEGAVSLAEGLWSLGKGAVNVGSRLATDSAYRQAAAEQTRALANSAVEYGSQLIDDPATRAQAYEQVQNLAGSLKQEFLDARAQAERDGKLSEFYGKLAGRGGFEVATFLVPAAKLSALGKAGDAAKLAEAVDVAKAAKAAETLAAVKAGKAVQACDDLIKASRQTFPALSLEGRTGKLVQHAPDWGFGTKGNVPAGAAEKVGAIAKSIVDNATSIRQGAWGKGTAITPDALFFSNGQHVVVTQSDGTLITILKNAANINQKFSNATHSWP